MAVKKDNNVKPSQPIEVDAYMKKLQHPLLKVAEALRGIILKADKEVGEEIKWNAPAFFYTGEMKPFDPKEYKRHIIVFNFGKKDCIRLVFPSGGKLKDSTGLLEGDYKDGRRLANFYNLKEVSAKEKDLQKIIKQWLMLADK